MCVCASRISGNEVNDDNDGERNGWLPTTECCSTYLLLNGRCIVAVILLESEGDRKRREKGRASAKREVMVFGGLQFNR